MRYRLGRSHQDIIYRQLGDEPSDEDPRVAVFTEAIEAIRVVRLLNGDEDEPGCPSCGTILNAKAANCAHPWHADNRSPADEPVSVPPPVDVVSSVIATIKAYGMSCKLLPTRSDNPAELLALSQAIGEVRALWASGVAEGRRQRDEEIKREVFTSARQVAEEARFTPVPEQVIVSYTQQTGAYEQGIYDAGIAEGRRQATEERTEEQRDEPWADGVCAACGYPVRSWRGGRVILDPDPTDAGDAVIIDGEPRSVIREDVLGRYPLYRSHFHTCPKHLVVDRG